MARMPRTHIQISAISRDGRAHTDAEMEAAIRACLSGYGIPTGEWAPCGDPSHGGPGGTYTTGTMAMPAAIGRRLRRDGQIDWSDDAIAICAEMP